MAGGWYGRNFPLTVALADTFVPDSTLADSRFLSAVRPNCGPTDGYCDGISPSPEPKLENHGVGPVAKLLPRPTIPPPMIATSHSTGWTRSSLLQVNRDAQPVPWHLQNGSAPPRL